VEDLSGVTGISARLSFPDENVRMRSLRMLPGAVRVTLTLGATDADGTERRETLEPVTIPIMAGQIYEPRRQ
jgi:hypothetical protein